MKRASRSACARPGRATPLLAGLATLPLLLAGCVERKVADVVAPGDLRIVSLTADPPVVSVSGQSRITAEVDNPSGSPLSYYWQAYRGYVNGMGPMVTYYGSYCCGGTDWVILTVESEAGEKHTGTLALTVLTE
jgi:hypothetical protein